MDEGVRPEEEVDGADEAQLAHERHRDGAGEPVAGDQRDASEPVPQVRHAAAAPGRRRGLATSRPLRKRRDETRAQPPPPPPPGHGGGPEPDVAPPNSAEPPPLLPAPPRPPAVPPRGWSGGSAAAAGPAGAAGQPALPSPRGACNAGLRETGGSRQQVLRLQKPRS